MASVRKASKLTKFRADGRAVTPDLLDRNLDSIGALFDELASEYRDLFSSGYASTYAAARLRTGTAAGQTLSVGGRSTAHDGGEGQFVWRLGVATDNDGTILVVSGSGGYWERIRADVVKYTWFGGSGLGVLDNAATLNTALAACVVMGAGELYVPEGTYLCNTADVSIPSGVVIVGSNRTKTILKFAAGFCLTSSGTIKAGICDLKAWNSSTAEAALYLTTPADSLMDTFTAHRCDFLNDNATGACVLGRGSSGAGGYGYVYWPSFYDCNWQSVSGVATSACFRTSNTGKGVLFPKIAGGRMTGAGKHFDLHQVSVGRYYGISHDDCYIDGVTGRFIYLGTAANFNHFIGTHFESSGRDRALEFTAGCQQNFVECTTPEDFSSVVGLTLGSLNSTSGFSQVSTGDSNIRIDPTTFNNLLQDVIKEKTAGNGVVIDTLKIKDGAILGQVNTVADVPAFVPGTTIHGIKRPDSASNQIAVGNGFAFLYGSNDFYSSSASGHGLDIDVDNKASTTTATATTLQFKSLPNNSAFTVVFVVMVYRTGGARATGAVGDVAKFVRRVTAKQVAGVTAILATETVGIDQADADLTAAAISVAAAVSGSDIVIKGTGTATLNLSWQSLAYVESFVS